ncbi:MAG: nucleotide sugar dehydrogenase [Candidatus Wallbacteria bacterium]|nr:nucleotide sugar dehydrogenase [Candidatus Wallbacteria bacterium]
MKSLCILGLGYVGLPTASLFATAGLKVTGVDTSPHVVRSLKDGFVHIEEAGLNTVVTAALASGNLVVEARPVEADAFIICVPTPVRADHTMDDGAIRSAAESLISVLKPGNLVVLESTVSPGTTRNFLIPILEKSGLKAGENLHVAYCPERVLPGHVLRELIQNDRIIGATDETSGRITRELYSKVVEGNIAVTDSTTAELSKLMENTYRDVNIALANEFSEICNHLGADAREVFRLANRHPRVKILSPGPGVGGHCIPVDPWFLVEACPDLCRLIRTAREVNDGRPAQVVQRLRQIVGNPPGRKISLLGLTYKPDVDDVRDSPAIHVMELLKQAEYGLGLYDPHVKRSPFELHGLIPALESTDCIVILTDHSEFKFLDPRQIASVVRSKHVLDTRGSLDASRWAAEGFTVHRF